MEPDGRHLCHVQRTAERKRNAVRRGVEVKDDATAGAITARAFKKGLVIERAGRDNAVIKIMPPLIISDEDLIAGLDILKAAIDGE